MEGKGRERRKEGGRWGMTGGPHLSLGDREEREGGMVWAGWGSWAGGGGGSAARGENKEGSWGFRPRGV
uniref:Uncharacterized protein n=1 Tax=Arundo donax TaxID=35708 RepID=A0A0A9H1E3_ARUDO